MWKFIELVLTPIFRIKAIALAVGAFILSLGLTFVVYAVLSLGSAQIGQDAWVFSFKPLDATSAVVVCAFFIVSFFIIWFLFHLQYTKEAEDIYSVLREKLRGMWQVTYDINSGLRGDDDRVPRPTVLCEFSINPDNKKLEMTFKIPDDNPVWRKGDPQVIRDISLRHERDKNYVLTYSFKDKQELTSNIADHIEPESAEGTSESLEVEVFASVKFQVVDDKVEKMQGEWFDLNGKLTLLGALLEEIDHAPDKRNFRKKLSAVPITLDNFSARMGGIEFEKIALSN